MSNVLTGWNFGDGHCLDERLIEALQERCQYEPGDVVVAWTESQPAFSKKVQYRVIDAALGTVEKGWYHNDDAYNEQPWLPNGPIPHTVTWTLPGTYPVPQPGSSPAITRRTRELARMCACCHASAAGDDAGDIVDVGDRRRQRAERARRRGAARPRRSRGDRARGQRHDRRWNAQLGDDRPRPGARSLLGRPSDRGRRHRSWPNWTWRPNGLTWLQPEVDCAHPLDDGSAGVLYRSIDRTADALGRRRSAVASSVRADRRRTSTTCSPTPPSRSCACRAIR